MRCPLASHIHRLLRQRSETAGRPDGAIIAGRLLHSALGGDVNAIGLILRMELDRDPALDAYYAEDDDDEPETDRQDVDA